MAGTSTVIRIGISGWRYPPWRGAFYPRGLAQRLELWYASRVLPTVEVNGSFYSLQRPAYYRDWREATPDDFVFAVKGPRFITHMKKLRDVETPLANFFASGIFNLREKCGPILWQLPPQFSYDRERLENFLEMLPHDTEAASRLARKHDAHLKGRACLAVDKKRRLRHAMEIRHDSFANAEFIALLRRYRVALVVAEAAKRWPMLQDVTADFIYMRLHGDKELYRSGYGDRALDRWANRIAAWASGTESGDVRPISPLPAALRRPRDIYCYFDNTDIKLRAPFDAQSLMRKLGLTPGTPPAWR